VLAVLLQGDRVGRLTVARTRAVSEVVDLLQTFATQSTLAIQNARRSARSGRPRAEIASQHKSQF
jgi:GAF domain-containing protein